MKITALLLFAAIAAPVLACDVCSCDNTGSGLSMNGHDISSQVGTRYIYKYLQLDNPVEDTRKMHVEYLDLHASYKPHSRIAINVSLPYIWQHKLSPLKTVKSNGIGDISLGVSVKLLDKISKRESRPWENKLYIAPSLEMPTGKYVLAAENDVVSKSAVIGSDSWDPSLFIHYQAMLPRWFQYAGAGVKLNTRNKEEFKLGNVFSLSYLAGYSNKIKLSSYAFSAGVRSDIYQKNTNHRILQKFSGGGEVAMVYGMQWTVWKTRLNIFLQHPIYQHLASGTLKNPVSIQTSIDFVF